VSVIGLFGPTASGKSDVAAALAALIPAEVVSADAMQVYEGLPILTNRSAHPERLVGIWPLTPLVVGGTGLYFRAALAELELPPPPTPGARDRWEQLYDEAGAGEAHARLQALDPAAATRVHPHDRRRVVRALELAEAGRSLVPAREALFAGGWRHPTLVVGLDVPKDTLERRIAERARAMFAAGVEEEVRAALGTEPSATASKIIGLHEVAELPREEAIEALLVRTRRYAAYQRKWLRRLEGLAMVAADRPPEEVAAEIVALARTRERLPRR
jgi:tRNA dimethylallyltransferase